jgi:hypothetical protein
MSPAWLFGNMSFFQLWSPDIWPFPSDSFFILDYFQIDYLEPRSFVAYFREYRLPSILRGSIPILYG